MPYSAKFGNTSAEFEEWMYDNENKRRILADTPRQELELRFCY